MPIHDKSDTPKSTVEVTSFHEIMEDIDQKSRVYPSESPVVTQTPSETDRQKPTTNKHRARTIIQSAPGTSIPDTHKKPGLQSKELLRLKQRKIIPDASIDLHGDTIEKALQKLEVTIQSSRQNNIRCILVICGKGLHSREGKAILRDAIRAWLIAYPDVLAYCLAKPRDGGEGALYLLLRTIRKT